MVNLKTCLANYNYKKLKNEYVCHEMDVLNSQNADLKLREIKRLSDWNINCKDCLKPNIMHNGRTKCNKEDQDDPLVATAESRAKF